MIRFVFGAVLSGLVSLPLASAWAARGQNECCSGPIPVETVDPVVSPLVYSGGTVVARVFVDSTGRVEDVRIVKPVPALVEPVTTALRRWRFKPPTAAGRPVASCTTIAVHVKLVRGAFEHR